MDHLMAVTAAGKCFVIWCDIRSGKPIVREEKIVTRTGTEPSQPHSKRQHWFVSLAGPPVR